MRSLLVLGAVTLSSFAATPTAFANDLLVPKQYRTIEAAQQAAVPGDRIVVRGGTYRELQLRRGGITILGRGATLAGHIWVDGSNLTLSGFRIAADAQVIVAGGNVRIAENLLRPKSTDDAGVIVRGGDRATIERNRGTTVGVKVEFGNRPVVRANRFRRGWIDVVGDDAVVESNKMIRTRTGITVWGNRTRVTDNDIQVKETYDWDPDCPGMIVSTSHSPGIQASAIRIEATEPGGVVERNRIRNVEGQGIVLTVSGASAQDNVVAGGPYGTSIVVVGSRNQVTGNDVLQRGVSDYSSCICVSGDGNAITENRVVGGSHDAITVFAGSGNSLAANALESSRGCGILVSGGASGTSVSGCSVTGCDLGFVNWGPGTSASESKFTDNRSADVLDLAGFQSFDSNTFGTLSVDASLAPQH